MKYTLITGGSGFIGSRIINKFNKNKIKINLKRKKNNTFFKNHNIINLDFSKKNLDFSFLKNINTVIHCASLNKFESEREPKKAKLVNYYFLEKFIDNCKKNKIKRFIKISTSKVYGNVLNKKISERSSLIPFDKYTEYHAKSDLLLNKLTKNSYLDIIVLRISNGYGYPVLNNPNWWDLIVNNFCYQAYFKKKIKIKSNIDYIKNYIDMEYLVNVIKFFNHYPDKINGIFNVGSKNNLSFLDIAQKVKILAKKNKLNNIKIFTDFKQNETNNNFSYDIKKMLDLGCLVKENWNNEINNLFKYLKGYARKV